MYKGPICALFRAEWVAQDQDDGVAAQEHLRNESFARHWLHFALAALGNFGPDLAYILQDHVAVTIEGLNARQEFLVVAYINEHLCLIFNALREES